MTQKLSLLKPPWRVVIARASAPLALLALVLPALWSQAALAAPRRVVEASQITSSLASGHSVFLAGVVVRGRIRLAALSAVAGGFVCSRCRLPDGIEAEDVRFNGTVDLGGSAIGGGADFAGASFSRRASLGPATTFRGPADFSQATFESVADFDRATFANTANFSGARFDGTARFEGSSAGDTGFAKLADFSGALFAGPADFRQQSFTSGARFEQADFGASADFTEAQFQQPVKFDDAHFAGDATFLGASLYSPSDQPAISLNYAVASGSLAFDSVDLTGSVQIGDLSARSLSFAGTDFSGNDTLWADNLRVSALALPLSDVGHIYGRTDQETLLGDIESTAKADDNLPLANDAHYRLEALRSRDRSTVVRILDVVVYRWVAGYLVRPLRPFLWLLGLVLFASLIRAVRRARGDRRTTIITIPLLASSVEALRSFANAFAQTVRRKPEATTSPVRLLETTVYAFLVVCIVLSLANTSPTLSHVVDALLKF